MLLLDDGSGRTIEVKIPRRRAKDLEDGAVTYPSNTLIDNVDVNDTWHVLKLPSLLYINNKPVCEGTVLKIKGTIAMFRERQIELKRVFVVRNTNDEVTFWTELAKLRRDVLAKPWVLTADEAKAIDDDIEAKKRQEQEWARAKRVGKAEWLERKGRSDEKREVQRRKKEQALNDGALKGSNIIKEAWESW